MDRPNTSEDLRHEWALDIAIAKETAGGSSEGSTLSISANSITPTDSASFYPVDAAGGGIINTIDLTNIRDAQMIFLHCVTSRNPITIANLATGSGAPIATSSGKNIVLNDPAIVLVLKYSATANQFQELFLYPELKSLKRVQKRSAQSLLR